MLTRTRTVLCASAVALCTALGASSAFALERNIQDIAAPERTLIGTTVEDYDGRFVGRVASVMLDSYGDADAIQIDDGRRVVTLDAGDLAYDDRANVVVAQLSRQDIDDMD